MWVNLNLIFKWLRKFYVYILLALIYIPLIFVVILSFNGQSIKGNIILDFTNNNLTIYNWINLFSDTSSDGFLANLLNSFLVAIVVAPISVIIGLLAAFGMWKAKSKTTKVMNSFATINISIPDIIAGISLSLIFTLIWLPLGLDYGYITVVIAHISFCIPYAIVAIYPRMNSLNKNLVYASNDLGASKLKTFYTVILPHLTPAIISAFIVVSAISFDDFVITLLVSGNFRTVATQIYLSAKGIKAWIVTFGALLIILFMIGTLILASYKIIRIKQKQKQNFKIAKNNQA